MNKVQSKSAFSLIELSIVILIIGILIAGVTQGSRLVSAFRISNARAITNSSDVNSISGLVLWLEPTMENSFAISSVPVTPSILTDVDEPNNNAGIGRWNDRNPQSLIKNHATQTVALFQQPLYKTGAINGLPALYFNSREATATDHYLVSSLNIDYTELNDVTIFMVYQLSTANSNTNYCLLGNDNGSFDRFLCPRYAPNSTTGTTSSGSTNVTVSAINTTAATIASMVLRNGGASNSSAVYVNGASAATFTESHSNSGTSNFYIGAVGNSSPTGFFNGYIAECIVFNRALKNEERRDVEKYLSNKWGIKIS